MGYTKQDAKMTQGLAIVCMVVLHLFCRLGKDIFGTPLLWVNDTTPFVYWFGFFAEICVPLYAMCAGFAQQLLHQSGKSVFNNRVKRIVRLMGNYWIILVMFGVAGWIVDPAGGIPGSAVTFVKNMFLLSSYNGAWWFLHTYVILLLIPPSVLLFPIKKTGSFAGLCVCGAWYGAVFLAEKLGFMTIPEIHPVLTYVLTEAKNLAGVLAYIWLGAWLCRHRVMDIVHRIWNEKVCLRGKQWLLLATAVLIFVAANLIHKALIMGPVALMIFVLFNLWKKSKFSQAVWTFLGEHSTNIWLVHMFFYAYIFKDLVIYAKYPVLIFLFMMALCIVTSYVIKGVQLGCTHAVRWLCSVRR